MEAVVSFIGIIVGAFLIWLVNKVPTKPSVCPNCKKEYVDAEKWTYTEYAWGMRCPHCKYEFDITP